MNARRMPENLVDRFLHPLTPEQFASEHWERRGRFFQGEPRRFVSMLELDFDVFRRIIARLVERGMPDGEITAQYFAGDASKALRIKPEQVEDLLAAGLTICVVQIHQYHPPLKRFIEQLSAAIGYRGTIISNCYVSPPGGGFGLHFDDRSVFSLHLEGEKTWWYSEQPAIPAPHRNLVANSELDLARFCSELKIPPVPLPAPTALREQLLKSGDMLYLPAGAWHRTAASNKPTMAVTLSCLALRMNELVRKVLVPPQLIDPTWRRTLPLAIGGTRESVEGFLAKNLSSLKGWVGAMQMADLMAAWDTLGKPDEPPATATMERHDRFLVPAGITVTRRGAEGEQLVIKVLSYEVSVGADAETFVRQLVTHHEFTGEMAATWDPTLEWEDVAGLLRDFVTVGIIRRAA
jgi:hypothetical protein